MNRRFRARKFVLTSTREELEKFVESWFKASNFPKAVTFEVKDVYYYYLDLVPTVASYLERFIRAQLKSGKRSWVVVTNLQISEIHRKFLNFHHWQSCEGVGSEYRSKVKY